MTFDELVDFIKQDGCRVVLYKGKEFINWNCKGTFDYNKHGPIICMALKGSPPSKRMEILVHEYAHYLQWRDGFMHYLDNICDAYAIQEDWFNGDIELSALELTAVRNTVLSIEYDAEVRAYHMAQELGLKNFSPISYLKGAEAYVAAIKWSFVRRKRWPETPTRKIFKGKLLTPKELFAPLTKGVLLKCDKQLTKGAKFNG